MGPTFIYNKKFDEGAKKWCVSPNTLQHQNTFLIVCDTEADADSVVSGLKGGTMKEPHTSPDGWEHLGEMSNPEKTPMFKRK